MSFAENLKAIRKEIDALLAALENGEPTYKLKYCAKVKKTFFRNHSVKIQFS